MNIETKPEWMLVCPKCGKRIPLRETGSIRIGAASIGKRTLGFCKGCKRLRLIKIVKGSRR
jgi:hypothetical protein